MEIKRPTIAHIESASIGSTLEIWYNRNVETPEIWVKIDRFTWKNTSVPSALLKRNNGLTLSRYYKVILTTEMEG